MFNYKHKNTSAKTFNDFTDAINLYEKIMKGDIDLEKVKENQIEFKSELTKIKRVQQKLDEQKSELENIQKLSTSRKNAVKIYDDCSSLESKAKYKEKHEKGLQMLTTKQILQRIPVALEQVKVGDTSENLLSEIRQIIYSLYRA